MAKKERRNPRNAPTERFFWREGDLEIIYDPYEDRARKADADPTMRGGRSPKHAPSAKALDRGHAASRL